MKSDAAEKEIEILGESFLLLPERAIYWERENALLIADVHLGKAGHFRSRGIPVPQQVATEDLLRISSLLDRHSPSGIIFLGDFFHSTINYEWKIFEEWRQKYPSLRLELVRGNHDIIRERNFSDLGIVLHRESLLLRSFILSHKPLPEDDIPPGSYAFCGHIHPSVMLSGSGRQRISLPCFHFGGRQAVLPAFGSFTGRARVFPKPGERVFVIAEGEVIGLNAR